MTSDKATNEKKTCEGVCLTLKGLSYLQVSLLHSLHLFKGIVPDFLGHTVDGRNPAPPGMYKTLYIK